MMGVFPVDFLDGNGLRMYCNPESKDPVGFKVGCQELFELYFIGLKLSNSAKGSIFRTNLLIA